MDDDGDLPASLASLAGLLAGGLEGTLLRVAQLAVTAIPRADGVGLTLLHPDGDQTLVATDDFVREVDAVQYSLAEGPCIDAVTERQVFTTGNLGGSAPWPHFGPQAGRLGVHSALSLPLVVPGRVVGALNVYAHARDAFDASSVLAGTAFAGPAAVSVANAQMLAHAERLAEQFRTALTHRARIDQAVGILMSRSGATADEAFARLRAMSQTRSVAVADVAQELLDEAVARARARHTGDV